GERPEKRLAEQHHESFLAQHHAGSLVVGELRVELEPEPRKELHAALEVADGQVDEDLAGHVIHPVKRSATPLTPLARKTHRSGTDEAPRRLTREDSAAARTAGRASACRESG